MGQLITSALIVAAVGIVAFFTSLWAYRRGLKDGLAINQGKTIEPIKTPIATVKTHMASKVNKQEDALINEGWNNIFTYDGKPQKVGE